MNDLFTPPTGPIPLGEVIECDNCGGRLFRTVVLLRRVSGIATGMPSDGLAPIQIFRCDDCSAVNTKLIPRGAGTPEELFGDDSTDDTQHSKLLTDV